MSKTYTSEEVAILVHGVLVLREENALLTKKLKGLEDIDEISAGYRDLLKHVLKTLEEEGCYPKMVEDFRKEFDEVNK